MAYNLTISGSSLIVTNTDDSSVVFEAPKRDSFFNSKDLKNGKLQIYDTSGQSELQAQGFSCSIEDAQIDGVAASESSCRDLQRLYMGFNSAPGGSGAPNNNEIRFISQKIDLPDGVNGVITLDDSVTYFFTSHIDLEGCKIVCGVDSVILGASSENCSITSTGISTSFPGDYMIHTEYTLAVRHITLKDVPLCVGINTMDTGMQPIALDWTGVNFSGCTENVCCGDIENFIFSKGAVLGSGSFCFEGMVGTLGIDNSLFTGDGSAYDIIYIGGEAVFSRRFRVVYTSFVAFGSSVAINVDPYAVIPVDSYILDTCNFSGGGVYIDGLGSDYTDNEPRWINCKGILNTANLGNMYMSSNAIATTISSTSTPVKMAGITIPNILNQKFSHIAGRLTYVGALDLDFQITAVASFIASGNDNIGVYVAKNGSIIVESGMYATINSGNNKAESVTTQAIVTVSNGDYLEVFVENNSAVQDITVEYLNMIVKSLN